MKERLQQIGKMSGFKLGDGDYDDEEDIGQQMQLNEDFLDEDWDPEKHEVSLICFFSSLIG